MSVQSDNVIVSQYSWSGREVTHPWHYFWYYLYLDIHRSPVNSPHKGQWRGALMFSLICAWIDGWVNNHEAGDLKRHRAHYDVTVMLYGVNVRPRYLLFCFAGGPKWWCGNHPCYRILHQPIHQHMAGRHLCLQRAASGKSNNWNLNVILTNLRHWLRADLWKLPLQPVT